MTLSFLKLSVLTVILTVVLGCDNSGQETVTNSVQSAAPLVPPSAVYTLTNDGTTNAVKEYRRNTNGTLTFVADYPTGGQGSGDSLNGSTNALSFDPTANRFCVVNAGSNSITVMNLAADGRLSVLNTVSSGGIRPISVTSFSDLVYVLNAGNADTAPNISGFRLTEGRLAPIAGSIQALSAANSNPAQIAFEPTRKVLAVTERNTNKISTFTLDAKGAAQPPQTQASNGKTPFGFDFTPDGLLVVSETQNAADGASTVSSYSLDTNGRLASKSASVPNGQTAACWVEINRFAPYAYVISTANNNISIYHLDETGQLSLVENGDSASTGEAPAEAAISKDAQFLYTLNTGDDSISVYSIGSEGRLTPITGVGGLPANAVGLVAR